MNTETIPEGYVLLARKIRKSSLWQSLKATHRIIMIELILQAQFRDCDVVRNGEILHLKRGQIATSYQQLVDDIGDKDVTVKVVRNAINKLVNHDFLAKDEAKARAKKGLLLTIVNYDVYQTPDNYKGKDEGKEKGNEGAKQGQSEGKARAINKNVNNDFKNDKPLSSNSIDEHLAAVFSFYTQNLQVGVSGTPYNDNLILEFYDEWGHDLLLAAMKVAAQKESKGTKYLQGILKKWKEAGVKSIEDARKFERDFKASGSYRKDNVFEIPNYEEAKDEVRNGKDSQASGNVRLFK